MFISVGLDIRIKNFDQICSADSSVWNQDEPLYEQAKLLDGVHENFLQLLHADSESDFSSLFELVENNGAQLILIGLPEEVISSFSPSHPEILLSGEYIYTSIGLDVCDINGFFSIHGIENFADDCNQLYSEEELTNALEQAEAANLALPEHRPFVPVKISIVSRNNSCKK